MIHPTADIQSKNIGSNSKFWQFVVVLPGAIVREFCNICSHCFIENDVIVGSHVTIKSGVYLWDGLRVDDYAFIGPNVTFTNDLFPRSKKYPSEFQITHIQKGASIGANATIVGGITIGPYALVGAGSVVTKNIPGNTLWYGNPARIQGYVCNCGNKLEKDESCLECGVSYQKIVDRQL